ncbi:hypothetical protein MBLNU230_g2805t2 [Neophaeotheca triangularis]
MFDRRAKTAPSQYPKGARIAFHLLRCGQLLASLIVGGIMSFFIWHLSHDKWSTPWTFLLLTAASLFSVAALLLTIVLHCCVGLNPRFNLACNGFLALLWSVSWGLLTWYMSGTLSHYCDVENWHEDVGIMICRIYKALFAFTLLGVLSTLAALALDCAVLRTNSRRGMYKLHDLDNKPRPTATRGPFTDEDHGYAVGGLQEPRESTAWEAPRPSGSAYEAPDGNKNMASQGYSVPEHQFDYDTGYRGGHEERALR